VHRDKANSALWIVADDRGNVVAGPFDTSAEAWRWADRAMGDPVSAAEKRGEYGFTKFMEGH
jgi:hypothetical protein